MDEEQSNTALAGDKNAAPTGGDASKDAQKTQPDRGLHRAAAMNDLETMKRFLHSGAGKLLVLLLPLLPTAVAYT